MNNSCPGQCVRSVNNKPKALKVEILPILTILQSLSFSSGSIFHLFTTSLHHKLHSILGILKGIFVLLLSRPWNHVCIWNELQEKAVFLFSSRCYKIDSCALDCLCRHNRCVMRLPTRKREKGRDLAASDLEIIVLFYHPFNYNWMHIYLLIIFISHQNIYKNVDLNNQNYCQVKNPVLLI